MQDRILDALRRGAHDDALELARQAVADAPRDADSRKLLAMALRAAGQRDAAMVEIDEALALAPDNAELHFQRAGMLIGERDIDAALWALAQSVTLDPNQYGAYVMQAQLAISRNDLDEAERQLKLAARVEPEHPWTAMIEGTLASRRGDHDRALALLADASARAPDDVQVLNALGFAYLARGHLAFAEQTFRRVLAATGQQQLRGLLARILVEQGRATEAADLVAELLADPAQASPVWQTLGGELELRAGRPERALPLLREAFSKMPESRRTTEALVGLWHARDAHDEARQALDQALTTHAGFDHLWLARLAFEPFASDAAGAIVERWNGRRPEYIPALQAQLAHQAAIGDHAGVEETARAMIMLQPGHAMANEFLFNRLLARDPEAAIGFAQSLLPAAHESARTMLQRWIGLAQDAAGRPDEAAATWVALSIESTAGTGRAPEPTTPPQAWPARAAVDGAPPPVVLMYGGPGASPERIAGVLERAVPDFRGDRFTGAVQDAFQDPTAATRFAAGQFTARQVIDGWRSQLPARGIERGAVVDWLPWWDNAWLAALRPELPHARLLLVLRDPRDMLIDWLAFGARLTLRIEDADSAAAWLARHLGQLADIIEQDLMPHTVVRTDAPAADPAAVAAALGEALGVPDLPPPPPALLGAERFAAGHWRRYAQALAGPIAALTPVAVRLGYPQD